MALSVGFMSDLTHSPRPSKRTRFHKEHGQLCRGLDPKTPDALRAERDFHAGSEYVHGSVVAPRGDTSYFENQTGAWCGMHALNNFLGGEYVNEETCRRAARRVVQALSEAGHGDTETMKDHLDPRTGWLSIDVINLIGLGNLALHVQERDVSWGTFRGGADDAAALLNWNKKHWSVLQKRATGWVHMNSILGKALYHGRRTFPIDDDGKRVSELLLRIRHAYGDVTIHPLEAADPTLGFVHLEREGVRFRVGRAEDEADVAAVPGRSAVLDGEPAGAAEVSRDIATRLRLVSLNADGCGTYHMSDSKRMQMMLDNLLTLEPDIIAFQEITVDMYSTIKHRLGGWSIYRRRDVTEEYFVVTAVCAQSTGAGDKCTSYAFPDSQGGRHVLVARRGQFCCCCCITSI